MISRVGNKDKSRSTELGMESYILAPSQLYTDYEQGAPEETGLPLDFCIQGEGFFAINRDGQIGYTRSGSFTLDDEGYLTLAGQGRVLDDEGQAIQLPTDKLYVDQTGGIYSEISRNYLATLGVYSFPDNGALEQNDRGLFTGGGAAISENYTILHGAVERSNVNMVQEMVSMMTTQRALQSAAQMSRIYDQVITRATSELGRI